MVPIIRSLLDTDFYKFTMGQLIFRLFRDIPVTFRFTNRTAHIPLAKYVSMDALRAEFEHMRTLRFMPDELAYLASIKNGDAPMFGADYLAFLAALVLPDFSLSSHDGQLEISFSGKWSEATYWEIPALATVNELFCRGYAPSCGITSASVYAEGMKRLAGKTEELKKYPYITFCDFGTRRRFSREWQEIELRVLAADLSRAQFLGTSNVLFAKERGLVAMGTTAHEPDMGYYGIFHGSDDEIRLSHQRMLRDWWEMYGHELSIALTDTYGSDFFFRDFSPEQARYWKGLRQDSGDPFAFGEKAIRFYKAHGIDPRGKLIIFSDGLELRKIIDLTLHFKGRIKTTFGWGTNLTNDLGCNALSIVVKIVESNGQGTVKLSDNLAKAIGKPEDVERCKRIFGYSATFNEACTY